MRIGILFCGILFYVSSFCGSAHSAQADKYGLDAIERAINDLTKTFPDEYKDGTKYLAEVGELPTESQWEGAGRAGSEDMRASSNSDQKTYQQNLMEKHGRCILMGGCGLGKLILQGEDNSLIWQMDEKRDSLDVWMLENGDIVYSTKEGLAKIRPDYQSGQGCELIWEVKAPEGFENYTSQPIGDDLYLVGYSSNEGSYVAEIDSSGKVHKRIEVEGQDSKHQSFRQVRKTEAGTYLTTQQSNGGKSKEYSADGKLLRTFPSGRFSVERLKNGNTLIGCGDEHRLIEVDKDNNIVWEVKQDDIEGFKLGFVAGVWALENGNVMISSWGGHGGAPGAAIVEIDRNKKLISSTGDSVSNKVASLYVIDNKS